MQSGAINRSEAIRNAEEEIRKEPNKGHGLRKVGISLIGMAKYAPSPCNALLTIPHASLVKSRVFSFFLKNPIHTFIVVCGLKSLPFWECKSAMPAMETAEIYHHHLVHHSD